jgi:hypothetical protein
VRAVSVPGNNAARLRMQAALSAVADRATISGADFHIEPQEAQALEAALGLAIVDVRTHARAA